MSGAWRAHGKGEKYIKLISWKKLSGEKRGEI